MDKLAELFHIPPEKLLVDKCGSEHERDLTDEEFIEYERNYYWDLHRLCSCSYEEMVIKTDTPYSLTKLTGLSLCCRQKQLVLDKKPTAGPLSTVGTGDLAVIINRYIPYVDREEPDSDNLNVTFLTAYDRRVKVIYVKAAHQDPPKSYNCVLHIAPMFAAEAAGLF